ncbi:MAG: hypothetical protein U0271_13650 [Polyangiaceae bacterium]
MIEANSGTSERQRVLVAWEVRAERMATLSKQLLAAMAWLRSLPELEGEWVAEVGRRKVKVACDSPPAAARCIAAGARSTPPALVPEVYRQAFYLGSPSRWRARVTLTAGTVHPPRGVPLPNRFELVLREPLAPQRARQAIVGLIGVYRPVFGVVGTERFPRAEPADARPAVGLVTYLSDWFGPVHDLPAGVEVASVTGFGSIIAAPAEALSLAPREQKTVVRELATALKARGLVRPYALEAARS